MATRTGFLSNKPELFCQQSPPDRMRGSIRSTENFRSMGAIEKIGRLGRRMATMCSGHLCHDWEETEPNSRLRGWGRHRKRLLSKRSIRYSWIVSERFL